MAHFRLSFVCPEYWALQGSRLTSPAQPCSGWFVAQDLVAPSPKMPAPPQLATRERGGGKSFPWHNPYPIELGNHQTYTAPTKGFRSKGDIFEGVVYDLSAPKRAAKYTPPPGLQLQCSTWFLWGCCADCGVRWIQQRYHRSRNHYIFRHRIWPDEGSTVQWKWSPPSPRSLKALLFPPLLNKAQSKGTQGVQANYGE